MMWSDFETANPSNFSESYDYEKEEITQAYMKYSRPSALNFIPSNEKERSDIFVNICRRYSALTLDYSVSEDLKNKLRHIIKQEMEMLMPSKSQA